MPALSGSNCILHMAISGRASFRRSRTAAPTNMVVRLRAAPAFALETFAAVREIWPERLVLSVRLGMTDFFLPVNRLRNPSNWCAG